ncbi:hypothetical protein [Ferrimicrobium acidiphilum]|uniref:hypothetical protein n=1 Tax=Ferrimicrobium acidiphilum TaxID=121039 RepID=UPI0023F4C896|nr:hypothetical protein [Ferrimicrobium acidiphilum]
MKVRNMVRGGAVVALSLGLTGAGTGMGLTASTVTPHSTVKSVMPAGALVSGRSLSLGSVASDGLLKEWIAQATGYVSTVNYHATLDPSFRLVASPAEVNAVSELVSSYNSDPIQMKSSGVKLYVPQTSTPSNTAIGPLELVPPHGGEGYWMEFQRPNWNTFIWWMSHSYGENLAEQLDVDGSVLNVIAGALGVDPASAVASGVAGALSAGSSSVATFISESANACGDEPFYVGFTFFVYPTRGC